MLSYDNLCYDMMNIDLTNVDALEKLGMAMSWI